MSTYAEMMNGNDCSDVAVKNEATDESVKDDGDFNDQTCQDETEILPDAPPVIQDINPIIKIENPNKTIGDGETLDQLEDVKSNSCDEDKD